MIKRDESKVSQDSQAKQKIISTPTPVKNWRSHSC